MRLATWWRSCYRFLREDYSPELWRLRFNFLVLVVFNFVEGIGETSTLSTFHQFITNPRKEDLNINETQSITPGLGQTEPFYAWMIAVSSIGEVITAVLVGFTVKWIPYWHLLFVSIVMHTISSLLYAIASNGWMMIVSELLSGAYGGIVETVAFAYIDARAASYERAYASKQQYNLRDNERLKKSRIKQKAYAVITFTETISYLAGPGICALVVQIPGVNQFRWVGWFNLALSILALMLLCGFFHGECQTARYAKKPKKGAIKAKKIPKWSFISKALLLKGTILICFLLATCTDSDESRIETIVNPVLSDVFGFTKKEISYYFIGVMVVYVAGSLFLIMFNPEENAKINNRLLTIITLVISMIGGLLMADWQSIGSDPCLQYSVFHNPSIITSLPDDINDRRWQVVSWQATECVYLDINDSAFQVEVEKLADAKMNSSVLDPVSVNERRLECNNLTTVGIVDPCPGCSNDSAASAGCMSYAVNVNGSCLIVESRLGVITDMFNSNSTSHNCNDIATPLSVCINIHNEELFSTEQMDNFEGTISMLNVIALNYPRDVLESMFERFQSIDHNDHDIIPDHTVEPVSEILRARELCLHSPHNCYWNQFSPLTKVECFDCPPICRGVHKSLNFILFSIGVAISAFVVPITEVVWTVLITDNLGDDVEKGPIMGLIVGAEGFAGVISPLWIDALYEAAGKRTFLAMIVDFALGVPILIGLILFYKHLQPGDHRYTELLSSSDSDSSSSSSSPSLSSSESDAEELEGIELTFMQAKDKEENLVALNQTTMVATIDI